MTEIKKAINVYFGYVAWRLSGVERLNHPFLEFKETINFLTDQIERKGRNVSPYGIPQDAFCLALFFHRDIRLQKWNLK